MTLKEEKLVHSNFHYVHFCLGLPPWIQILHVLYFLDKKLNMNKQTAKTDEDAEAMTGLNSQGRSHWSGHKQWCDCLYLHGFFTYKLDQTNVYWNY